jgi:hypothetical protein
LFKGVLRTAGPAAEKNTPSRFLQGERVAAHAAHHTCIFVIRFFNSLHADDLLKNDYILGFMAKYP